MKGRKRGKTMLATSTPELKRLRIEQEGRQAKKHGKISGSAKCKKTLFEAKHAGKKEFVPSTSERFETKKKGEKTKKQCSKKGVEQNLRGTSERKTKKCDKSKSKGSEKGSKKTVLTRDERFKRNTKTCAKSANKAIHYTMSPQKQVQPLVIRKPTWLQCQATTSGRSFSIIGP
jgi:hypothetical protein